MIAMIYLIVLGSFVGFTAYSWLLRNTRPLLATSYAFVNPVVAVVLGVVIAAEPLGWQTLIATPLVAAAVVLVVTARR
jgi:drug/metabolite transporter (DMT)-like permease